MEERKLNFMYTTVGVLIVIGIVILANILVQRFFVRWDLTEGNVYSLSKASKEIMRELDDIVTVKVYFSPNLPSPYNNHEQFIRDQLDEYYAYSHGNLQYEFINPDESEETKQDAQQMGIAPVQVQVIDKDRFEVKQAYMGLVIMYEEKREVMPFIQNLNSFEYDMTSAIQRIIAESKPKIAFLRGHEEPDLGDLRLELEKQYEIVELTIEGEKTVPIDIQALIIHSPKSALSEWEIYAIDQYIMQGGKVAFLIDKVVANLQTISAQVQQLGIDQWLATYGIRINDDLVYDAQNQPITIQQQNGPFVMRSQVNYPFIPLCRNFNPENVMVSDMEVVSFPFVSTIDTTLTVEKGYQIEVLARTSEYSGTQSGRFSINPTEKIPKESYTEQFLPIAAVVKGKFKSHFADTGAPMPDTDDTLSTNLPISEVIPEASAENRLIVVGDGEFTQGSAGMILLMNMIDWMTQGEGLISIRSRGVSDRPLKEVSEGTKGFVKFINLLGMPLLVIIIGIIYWMIRRQRKRRVY